MTPIDLSHHGDREVRETTPSTTVQLVDFAVNVAVPAPPPWLRSQLEKALGDVAAYPDVEPAVDALCRLHGCSPASVLVTNGAAEAFTLIARGRHWRRPVVVHPQFTEPESALAANGYSVARLILSPDNGFELDPSQVDEDADLVIIGNPTNPTSRLHPRATILGLLRPGRVVVVDEAFMDVVAHQGDSVLDDAVRGEGLVVIRSLTKTFGLAGIRAGYVVGDSIVVAECAATQPHWSVNSLAVAATVACAGARGQEHVRAVSRDVTVRLSYLVSKLTAAGLDVVRDPAGPFVLVHHPAAARLREGLRHQGIAVRRGDTFPGLGPQWLRIAAREPDATDALLTAVTHELAVIGNGSNTSASSHSSHSSHNTATNDSHEPAIMAQQNRDLG
ncbi:MAG: cobyrinic acid a,c-diamide synthase [Actinomycetota bacterium]|jgi:histidinol-phosphate/aromatic aminotransferase/cobyric acid decarboxylase-like protein|nr:cobyrinic acid a,c-diamide synthase [Actinomycetota bacterium]